jgi:hypothetical protein
VRGNELLGAGLPDFPQLQFFLLLALQLRMDDVGVEDLFILHGGGSELVGRSLHLLGLESAVFLGDDGQTVPVLFLELLLAVRLALRSECAAHYINIIENALKSLSINTTEDPGVLRKPRDGGLGADSGGMEEWRNGGVGKVRGVKLTK